MKNGIASGVAFFSLHVNSKLNEGREVNFLIVISKNEPFPPKIKSLNPPPFCKIVEISLSPFFLH